MKKLLLAFLAPLVLSPVAHATPDNPTWEEEQFVRHAHMMGIFNTNGDESLISAGYALCGQMRNHSPQDTAQWVYIQAKGGGEIGISGAQQFVGLAISDLCPEAAN